MIEQFDTYICTDRGFIATKGDLMFDCNRNGSSSFKDNFRVSMYRSGQKHKRALAHAAEGTRAWCREAVIRMIERETAKAA